MHEMKKQGYQLKYFFILVTSSILYLSTQAQDRNISQSSNPKAAKRKARQQKIENYIGKKIVDKIPNVHDKSLPNFGPVKGLVGSHKEVMSAALIKKIEDFLLKFTNQETKEKR